MHKSLRCPEACCIDEKCGADHNSYISGAVAVVLIVSDFLASVTI